MKQYKRVIIVDDDFANNLICEKVLLGYNLTESIRSFLTIQEGLDYLNQVKESEEYPDLILLDINFPLEDGWDFLDEFKRINILAQKPTELYMLTSSISSRDIEKSQNHPNVKGFISKPLNKEKLDKYFS